MSKTKTYLCDLRKPATCLFQNNQDYKECVSDEVATMEIKICPYRYESVVWREKHLNAYKSYKENNEKPINN